MGLYFMLQLPRKIINHGNQHRKPLGIWLIGPQYLFNKVVKLVARLHPYIHHMCSERGALIVSRWDEGNMRAFWHGSAGRVKRVTSFERRRVSRSTEDKLSQNPNMSAWSSAHMFTQVGLACTDSVTVPNMSSLRVVLGRLSVLEPVITWREKAQATSLPTYLPTSLKALDGVWKRKYHENRRPLDVTVEIFETHPYTVLFNVNKNQCLLSLFFRPLASADGVQYSIKHNFYLQSSLTVCKREQLDCRFFTQ